MRGKVICREVVERYLPDVPLVYGKEEASVTALSQD
jgi:hypothetical protein